MYVHINVITLLALLTSRLRLTDGAAMRYTFAVTANTYLNGINKQDLVNGSPAECALVCALASYNCQSADVLGNECWTSQYTGADGPLKYYENNEYIQKLSAEPALVVFAPNGALANTTETTLFLDGKSLSCPVYPVGAVVKFRVPVEAATGVVTVEIRGRGFSCQDDENGRTYVMGISEAQNEAWTGRFQRCSLTYADAPAASAQKCVYACTCTDACAALQVVHVPMPVATTDVKICFIHIQWFNKLHLFVM